MNRVPFLSLLTLLVFGVADPVKTQASAPVKLNGPLVSDGDVAISGLQFSPDGGSVLYLADQNQNSVVEAFVVPGGGGMPLKVNGPLVVGGNVQSAKFSPDGARVIYHANQDNDGNTDLYSVPSGGGSPVKLNGALPANRSVGAIVILSDGSRVVYSADQEAASVFELYSVPIDGGPPIKLNGPLVAGGDAFLVEANSAADKVFYLADQDTDGRNELYAVSGNGGMPIKLNGSMTHSAGINGKGVAISRDGSRAVYLADQLVDDVFELFSAPSAGGVAVRLNAPMVVGGDVLQSSIFISANSSRVIYRADADADGAVELFSVPIVGGSPTKLNGQLTLGGNVLESSLQFSSDSSHVLYLADQEALSY